LKLRVYNAVSYAVPVPALPVLRPLTRKKKKKKEKERGVYPQCTQG
jgi:hypothetical protein